MDQQTGNKFKAAPALPGTGSRPPKPPIDVTDPGAPEKHDESVKKYPELSLSPNEYVITVARRNSVGLIAIWAFVLLIGAIISAALVWYSMSGDVIAKMFSISGDMPSAVSLAPLALILLALVVLGGLIASYVYIDNRLYLTNESIFQFVRTGILQQKTQIINLINIEDTSKEQNGVMQNLFNYGTLRLSTQGQETTYHFYYLTSPDHLVNLINDASERAVRRLEGFPAGEF